MSGTAGGLLRRRRKRRLKPKFPMGRRCIRGGRAFPWLPTVSMFQFLSSRRAAGRVRPPRTATSLADLREEEEATLDRIDLDPDQAQHLMELGFIPGARVVAGRAAPGGDPRVYRVDGAEVALRRETARRLKLRKSEPDRGAP